jgi:hypothetical protein
MRKNLVASLLIAASAAFVAPAFASSGYGPEPSYKPLVGAPASQRGQSVQTITAEKAATTAGTQAYGGAKDTTSESGRRISAKDERSMYSHN